MNISTLKDRYRGIDCVVIGNGPGLHNTPPDTIPSDMLSFGTNRIYLSGYKPDFYVCVNDLVVEQFHEEILRELQGVTKFIPYRFRDYFMHDPDTVFILTGADPDFYHDLSGPIWEGHTVTYVAMQLVSYMGFRAGFLIGVDHYFSTTGPRNAERIEVEPDKNHFHPDYFGPGVKWNLPDLAMSEIAYSYAERASRTKFYNCSMPTQLDIFPLANWNRVCMSRRRWVPRVSALISAYYCGFDMMMGMFEDLYNQTQPPQMIVAYQEGSEEQKACLMVQENVPDDMKKYLTLINTGDKVPTIYDAWNTCLQHATGKYITNCNTDDRHNERYMEVMANILDGNHKVDVVYADTYVTWKPNQRYDEFIEEMKELPGLAPGRVQDKPGLFQWRDHNPSILVEGCYLGPQPMWRYSLHQKHGSFDPSFEVSGDYDFWVRCAKEDNYLHIPTPLGLYLASPTGKEIANPEIKYYEDQRVKAKNMSRDIQIRPLDDLSSLVKVGNEFTVVDTVELHEIVTRQIPHSVLK